MKKTIIGIFAVAALVVSQAWAVPVTVTRLAGYAVGDGGEFNIAPVFGNGSYAPAVLVGGGFETFCVQASGLNSTIGPLPATYDATLASSPVSLGTAWLYYQFATGNLAGYKYTDFSATLVNTLNYPAGFPTTARAGSAYGLQAAIWVLEGFTGYPVDTAAAASWLALVEGATGKTLGQLQAQNNGTYQVARVVLTDANRNQVQNMLALVPDGGSALMLLGMGLSGLALVSRKLRA